MSTSSDWFRIQEIDDAIFVIEEVGHVQSYLVNGSQSSALIDTGAGLCNIREALGPFLRPHVIVLNTHWHFDHIGGNILFDTVGISEAEQYLLEQDLSNDLLMEAYVKPFMAQGVPFPPNFEPERYEIRGRSPAFLLYDGDRYDLGGRELEAIATPGHTCGSMSFLDRSTGSLFCGDLIYRGTIFAHFADSDVGAYIGSLSRLLDRVEELRFLYPGHTDYPLSTELLGTLVDGFHKTRDGTLPATVVHDWAEPVYAYPYQEFVILTKQPGSSGVKLFDLV
jgi:glyoxylase-like metal-dependent hydrolase (beta-lactamase superfamily II)